MTQDRPETGAQKGSPLDKFEQEAPKERTGRGLKVALWSTLGLVVLAGGYVTAQVVTADQIARGTTVAGVDIGGRSRADAVALLDAPLGERATAPITVTAGELTSELDPAEAGLGLDARGTVAGLTGFSLAPADLVRSLFGGDEIAPSITLDDDLLRKEISETAESLRTEPVDGKVAFVDGRVEPFVDPARICLQER